MAAPDYEMTQAFEKIPDIHKLLVKTLLLSWDEFNSYLRTNPSKEEGGNKEMTLFKNNIKESLWALSNLVAGPPYILDHILADSTLEDIMKIT